MGDQIDLVDRNVEHFLQDIHGLLAHDDQAVGKGHNFLHHRAFIGIWFAKHGVQCCSERHFEAPKQFEDMSASASAKDAIFVLQADQIDIAEIQKVGGVPVGI